MIVNETVFTESSLHDSVLFNTFNKNSVMSSMVNECFKHGTILTAEHIEEQLIQIKKTRLSPLADKVITAFNKGEILLLFSKNVQVSQALPFIVLKMQGQLKAVVFLSNYGTLVSNDKIGNAQYLNMPMKDLYALMEGAYTALSYAQYQIGIIKNMGLMKLCSNIYTQMILRILNKEYAISMEKEIVDRVSFAISRFFLDNVWENANKDINTNYAINAILSPNKMDLALVAEQFNEANVKNVEQLIAFLKTLTKRFNNLNLRYFTQCYLNTFKSSALFSMECLPYFLYTIQTACLGSFIVNQPIITDICKNIKGMDTFYAELTKSV
jgi:hypothetical protein